MAVLKFEQILLRCFYHIRGERSSSNVYHLLKGKRSIQTIQDAHIYELKKYYGIYKNLYKSHFDMKTQQLVKARFLVRLHDQESTYGITNQGLDWLNSYSNELYFNGLSYFDKADLFMERLLLLVQTLTNSKMNFYSFIPVIHNQEVEQWMKKVYRNVKGSESNMLKHLYDELFILLSEFPEKEATMFVDRLSGYKTYGLSLFQMETQYELTKDDVHLLLQSIVHRMVRKIENNLTQYPTLSALIENNSEVTLLTHSAKQTYSYYLKKYTVEQIANIRKLKKNTIYDHLVEIALYDEDFPIRDFVTDQDQKEILEAMKNANSHRLKHIKDWLGDHINYFQIRLVIALRNKQV